MITLVQLYGSLMNLYGDYANLPALTRLLAANGLEARVVSADDEAEACLADADLIYVGSGTERSLKTAMEDLPRLAGAVRGAVERGCQVLATGNGVALFLDTLTDGEDRWTGLGLAEGEARIVRRSYGDVIFELDGGEAVVGSYNSGLEVTSARPALFRVRYDSNGKFSGQEGIQTDSLLATQLVGPALQKNPALLTLAARRLTGREDWDLSAFAYARQARDSMLKTLEAAAGK